MACFSDSNSSSAGWQRNRSGQTWGRRSPILQQNMSLFVEDTRSQEQKNEMADYNQYYLSSDSLIGCIFSIIIS